MKTHDSTVRRDSVENRRRRVLRREWRMRHVPYCVVIHGSGFAAAYNRHYQLIGEQVSPSLLRHVHNRHRTKEKGFSFTFPHQRPSWLRPGMEAECITYYTYLDNDTDNVDWLSAIPLI